jgi:hypothetical protein
MAVEVDGGWGERDKAASKRQADRHYVYVFVWRWRLMVVEVREIKRQARDK